MGTTIEPVIAKREIDDTKLSALKTLGYQGERTIEDMMIVLNKVKPKLVNGQAWWIDFKNKAAEKGTSFLDAVYAEVTKELKK